MVTGRSFHARGPATANDLSQYNTMQTARLGGSSAAKTDTQKQVKQITEY